MTDFSRDNIAQKFFLSHIFISYKNILFQNSQWRYLNPHFCSNMQRFTKESFLRSPSKFFTFPLIFSFLYIVWTWFLYQWKNICWDIVLNTKNAAFRPFLVDLKQVEVKVSTHNSFKWESQLWRILEILLSGNLDSTFHFKSHRVARVTRIWLKFSLECCPEICLLIGK